MLGQRHTRDQEKSENKQAERQGLLRLAPKCSKWRERRVTRSRRAKPRIHHLHFPQSVRLAFPPLPRLVEHSSLVSSFQTGYVDGHRFCNYLSGFVASYPDLSGRWAETLPSGVLVATDAAKLLTS